MFFFSVKEKLGLERLCEALQGKTTALAGPSGVGKSSLINFLCPDAGMETGDISRKIERGRHTTRHAEIFARNENTFVGMEKFRKRGHHSCFSRNRAYCKDHPFFKQRITSGFSHRAAPDSGNQVVFS